MLTSSSARAILSFAACLALLLSSALAPIARGQIVGNPVQLGGGAGGVYIDPEGTVRWREADPARELEQARARARNLAAAKPGTAGAIGKIGTAGKPGAAERLTYISLPRLLSEVRQRLSAGQEIPEELRYLGGMTQLRYVFAYPAHDGGQTGDANRIDEIGDLVIAGPAEPWDAENPWEPVGKLTGRPVLQLDDLVVALRLGDALQRGQPLGCSIDPAPDSLQKSGQVMRDYANRSRAQRMTAMAEALGPQKVSVFGAAADTRLAMVCVAADYKLKRLSLGIDPPLAPGVGNAIDNSRAAGSRVWFELMYEPLLVSADGNAFQLRGQRLQMKAGALSFDPRGATPKAEVFAKQFTQKMPALASRVPVFADLQNIADLTVLAALIRHDRLDRRTGFDTSWLLADRRDRHDRREQQNDRDNRQGPAYAVATVPVPQQAQTLVNYTNGSIAAGGVSLTVTPILADNARQADAKNTLAQPRQQYERLKNNPPKSTANGNEASAPPAILTTP